MNPPPVSPTSIQELKDRQAAAWGAGNFDAIAQLTSVYAAPRVVRFAGVLPGEKILDGATGTGLVALCAARAGGEVTGIDFAPPLLDRARANAELAGAGPVTFHVGDAEAIPFPDDSFDVVLSQYGHIFAPRPDVATTEMLRVLRPGGRLAFSTWTPSSLPGRLFGVLARYVPPPPGIPSPAVWGVRDFVTERLGARVGELAFSVAEFYIRASSPQYYVEFVRNNFGPLQRALEALEPEPARREAFERELLALYSEGSDIGGANIRHEYLLTRARKL